MVAKMIVSARTALLFRIDSKTALEPDFVQDTIETYIKFVSNGLSIE